MKQNLSKFWKLLFSPYCFGDPYYMTCSARYSVGFCSVADECTKECRRREK